MKHRTLSPFENLFCLSLKWDKCSRSPDSYRLWVHCLRWIQACVYPITLSRSISFMVITALNCLISLHINSIWEFEVRKCSIRWNDATIFDVCSWSIQTGVISIACDTMSSGCARSELVCLQHSWRTIRHGIGLAAAWFVIKCRFACKHALEFALLRSLRALMPAGDPAAHTNTMRYEMFEWKIDFRLDSCDILNELQLRNMNARCNS